MRKHVLTCLPMAWGLAFCSSMSMAQLVEDYHPSQAGCCLERAARQLAEQLQDWNQLGRYYDDNRSLQVRPPQPGRVVFIGD